MKTSGRRAIASNMASQAFMQAVIFIVGLLVPRYILLLYGSEINGVATTVSQIVNYASLLEAGLGLASIQALYRPIATKNQEEINGICAATKNYYLKLTGWFSAVIAVSAVAYAFLAKGTTDRMTIGLIVLAISLSSIIEYAFHAKYNVLLVADQKLYVISYSKAIGLIAQAAVKIILIRLHANIVLVYALGSLALVARIPFLALYVRKKYPDVRFNGKMNLVALKQRSALLIHQIAGLVVNNSGAIIVSVTSGDGLKLASVYAVYRLVFKNMHALVTGAFSNGSVATFGQMLAADRLEDARASFRRFETLFSIVIGILYGAIASLILPFVGLYTKGVTDIEYILPRLALLMTVSEVLNCTRIPCGMLINAAGHFHQTKYRAAAEALINFVVTLLLIKRYDIYAIAIAGVVSYVYRVTDIILYSNKRILLDSPLRSLASIVISWLGVAATWAVMHRFTAHISGWGSFIVYGILTVLVAGLLCGLIGAAIYPRVAARLVNKAWSRVFGKKE